MNYIALDLEFNQPYDFVNNCKSTPVEGCQFEIIQIGAVKMDNELNIVGSFNMFIKPVIYPALHPFVVKVTGFRERDFIDAVTFAEAYEAFRDFLGAEKFVFCLWGAGDLNIFFNNIKYYNLNPRFLYAKYVNVQQGASMRLKLPHGMMIGLQKAVQLLNLETDEHFHNAFNDAVYTAQIFKIVNDNKMQINVFKPKL